MNSPQISYEDMIRHLALGEAEERALSLAPW